MGRITTRRWCFVLILFCIATLLTSTAQAQNPRYAGIVVDTETSEILYAENADAPRYPASLTKMMTLYMLFESLERGSMKLNQPLPVSSTASKMPATKLWLKPGSSLPVETAIKALVVRSANDVAVVVAEALGGSEDHFARMMTSRAHEMGMQDTIFRNASGLPDDRQVTTARDMAMLARRLMLDFPEYYHYFSKSRFSWRGKTVTGHNNLLDTYPGADGLKTGFIRASGFNVATSAKRHGRRMLAVVMGGYSSSSRDEHMADLLDRGFMRASLNNGRGFLANTRIANDYLLPRSERPMLPSGGMMASRGNSVASLPSSPASPPVDTDAASGGTASTPSQDETIVANASSTASASNTSSSATTSSSPNIANATNTASNSADSAVVSTDEPADSSTGPVVSSLNEPSTSAAATASEPASAEPAQVASAAPASTPEVASTSQASGSTAASADAPRLGDWGVQVGAFSDADNARRLAARAAERLTAELADARVAVPHVADANVYRARLVDMAEPQARNACRRLQAQGMDCMVVQAAF
ncbi:SPOR domain-containing protein [Halomonas sp. 18H]|uniref:serine hydrolase n=1 Tax=Halomonas almeriensis TaxID=308163 RepID=UPI00222E5E32|nr:MULTISPECIES: serine hydrolase [Halomonas]MCW4153024.1 SPOR domain-containing protein [Halomonas sp. 18H]MDN3554285.1 SPOR domain-containing protein [Halomonas almeriensis]